MKSAIEYIAELAEQDVVAHAEEPAKEKEPLPAFFKKSSVAVADQQATDFSTEADAKTGDQPVSAQIAETVSDTVEDAVPALSVCKALMVIDQELITSESVENDSLSNKPVMSLQELAGETSSEINTDHDQQAFAQDEDLLGQLRSLIMGEEALSSLHTLSQSGQEALPGSSDPESALAELRQLLMIEERQELQHIREELTHWRDELDDPQRLDQRVSEVVSESLQLRMGRDDSVADVLLPAVESSLTHSVQSHPKKLADALYPVMGPAIRKSINEVLSQTLETFNQLLEQSLSAKSLFWRFDAWRTGRSYPEVVLLKTLVYHVEQVFLIHHETSLLLQHLVSEQAITRDPDMVSSMLTAIQDFISDSFVVDQDSTLQNLKLGDLTVLVEQGPYAVLAVVVHGSVPASLPVLLRDTQEEIHHIMSGQLQSFEGDSEPFNAIRPLLERCLITRTQQDEEKRRPWMAYIAIAGLVAGLSYWSYAQYQENKAWQTVFEHIDEQPGIVVLDKRKTSAGYQIQGLRDPLAQQPEQFLKGQSVDKSQLAFSFTPYISVDAEIVRKRISQVLSPPEGAQLSYHEETGLLLVSGEADSQWGRYIEQVWPLVHGVGALDMQDLKLHNAEEAEKRALEKRLQELGKQLIEARYPFEKAGADIDTQSENFLEQVSLIKRLMKSARENGKGVVIYLTGMTDGKGSEEFNRQLSLKRASNMRDALSLAGVPEYLIQIRRNGEAAIQTMERSVRYTFELY